MCLLDDHEVLEQAFSLGFCARLERCVASVRRRERTPAGDALDEPVEEGLEGFGIRRTDGMESWSVGFLGVDAVENEHVQMNLAG